MTLQINFLASEPIINCVSILADVSNSHLFCAKKKVFSCVSILVLGVWCTLPASWKWRVTISSFLTIISCLILFPLPFEAIIDIYCQCYGCLDYYNYFCICCFNMLVAADPFSFTFY